MSSGATSTGNNGVIRVGRKGLKKFAFGEDTESFEIDVVEVFQEWLTIDESFRDESRNIPSDKMAAYHGIMVQFVVGKAAGTVSTITKAEALEFLAELQGQYEDLAVFFRKKSAPKPSSVESTEVRFSTSET